MGHITSRHRKYLKHDVESEDIRMPEQVGVESAGEEDHVEQPETSQQQVSSPIAGRLRSRARRGERAAAVRPGTANPDIHYQGASKSSQVTFEEESSQKVGRMASTPNCSIILGTWGFLASAALIVISMLYANSCAPELEVDGGAADSKNVVFQKYDILNFDDGKVETQGDGTPCPPCTPRISFT